MKSPRFSRKSAHAENGLLVHDQGPWRDRLKAGFWMHFNGVETIGFSMLFDLVNQVSHVAGALCHLEHVSERTL
jgi:hypothetical protein